MDRETIEKKELNEMLNRLNQEVDLLHQAIDESGKGMNEKYAEKVARSQLEDIGEVVESMSQHIGDGDKISVTTPSQLGDEQSE